MKSMSNTSLQVCMDSSDHWGTMSEDMSSGVDHSSSSPSGGGSDCMLAAACSSRAGPPLTERGLRPPHDTNLKCPRCDSAHTKFCYYNNYSLSQPRYFCKTCRRYWTKGGTLRNIPVGGGCRKNKKSTSKKSNDQHHQPLQYGGSNDLVTASSNPTDLHLSFPEVQFPPHLANLIGAQMGLGGANFMEAGLLRPIDFMESKYEGLVGGISRGHDFMGGGNGNHHDFDVISGIEDHHLGNGGAYSGISSIGALGNICSSTSSFLMSGTHNIHDGNSAGISLMDQRLLLPYDENDNYHNHRQNGADVKPNPKLLSLEWQDQGCASNNVKDSSHGYIVSGPLNSWSGMMGGFQSSTTNSLV